MSYDTEDPLREGGWWSRSASREGGWWLRLFLVAALVRLAAVVGLWEGLPLVSDPASYLQIAEAVTHGELGTAPLYWPPGWSLLLAPVVATMGADAIAARLATAAIGTLTVLGVAVLARQTLGAGSAMRWSGWVAALYPPAVLAAGFPHTHHAAGLCLVLLAILVIHGYRSRRLFAWFAAGLVLGGGALVRPSMLALLPCLGLLGLVVYLRQRSRRKQVAAGGVLLLLGASLLVVPVLHLNAARGGGYVISANAEHNVLYGNNPYAPLYKTSHFGSRPNGTLPLDFQIYIDRLARSPDPREAMKREAWRYVQDAPLVTLLRTANRIRAFWGFDYGTSRLLQAQGRVDAHGMLLLLVAEAGGYVLFMVLVLIGLCSTRRLRFAELLLVLVGGYQLPYALVFSSGIYHFPVVFLLTPFAGLAVALLTEPGRSWRERPRLLLAAVALLVILQVEYAYFTLQYAPEDVLAHRMDSTAPCEDVQRVAQAADVVAVEQHANSTRPQPAGVLRRSP